MVGSGCRSGKWVSWWEVGVVVGSGCRSGKCILSSAPISNEKQTLSAGWHRAVRVVSFPPARSGAKHRPGKKNTNLYYIGLQTTDVLRGVLDGWMACNPTQVYRAGSSRVQGKNRAGSEGVPHLKIEVVSHGYDLDNECVRTIVVECSFINLSKFSSST